MSSRLLVFARWNSLIARACHHGPATAGHCGACCREALAALVAAAPGGVWSVPDDEGSCAVCGAGLAVEPAAGCVRGRCAADPVPARFHAPQRACREYHRMVLHTGTGHRFYDSREAWRPGSVTPVAAGSYSS